MCKFWDREIAKLIRKETKTNLSHILEPYPNGIGWTIQNNSFKYNVPYPEVHAFRNVVLDFRPYDDRSDDDDECVVENKLPHLLSARMKPKVEKWFELMGSDVRSLYISIISVPSHYRILERILKEWCPNLESLTLIGVNLDGLVLTSGFTDTDRRVVCNGLKTLQIGKKLPSYKLRTGPMPNYYPNVGFDIDLLNQFIYQHGIPESCLTFPEIVNSSGVKVVVPEKEIACNKELPDLSQYFPDNFFPHNYDGGILGQLMKSTRVEKLILHWFWLNLKHIVALFHYRHNKWRTSLNHLEFDGNKLSNLERLIVLSKLKCPITTLKFPDFYYDDDEMVVEKMTRSDTLEYLSFSGSREIQATPGRLVLPFLPKLKIFEHNSIGENGLSATDLFQSAPNLEQCYLEDARFCFDEENVVKCEKMKSFKLIGVGCPNGEQACKILAWFPNLDRLELDLINKKNDICNFITKLSDSKVRHFKMNWMTSGGCKDTKHNALLIKSFQQLKSEKFYNSFFTY